jgi:hypothetical protein
MRPIFLDRRCKKDENLSWDTISDAILSQLQSESPSLPQTPNLKG